MAADVIHPDVYEVRMGLQRRDYLLIPLSVAAVAFGVWGFTQRPFRAIVVILVGLGFLVTRFVVLRSTPLVLRVDESGVCLGGHAVPWPEISTVVLWSLRSNLTTIDYIGLDRGGRPPLDPGRAEDYDTLADAPEHVPTRVVVDSVPIAMWKLDEEALRTTMRRYAPGISLVKH
jgi:hypothetical protein